MTPSRRAVLRNAGFALLGSIAGCGGREPETDTPPSTPTETVTPSPSDTPTETPIQTPSATGTYVQGLSGPADYPERPADLTRYAATEYVKAVEHARMENEMRSYGEHKVEKLELRCRSYYVTHAHGGHYVLAACTGYANYEDGSHTDWGQSPGFYFVAPNLTIGSGQPTPEHRDCETIFAAVDDDENFATPCEESAASFRLYGFHPEPHDVTVTVEFLGVDGTATGSSQVAFEQAYELAPASGVSQDGVTYRRGKYRLTAKLDTGAEATYRWSLSTAPGSDTPPVSVLVTPTAGVRIRRPPFPEIIGP